MDKRNNLIWLDLEMTGLDYENDKIIEIATIVTDTNLEIIDTGPEIVIHQSDAILEGMDSWCTKQHQSSGLTAKVKTSKVDEKQAETLTLEFIKQYVAENASPMCGNTICADRRFLYKHMPDLEKFFHYRNLDVSTIKILAQRWAPTVEKKVEKNNSHRALDDIIESINELKLYRKHFIIEGD